MKMKKYTPVIESFIIDDFDDTEIFHVIKGGRKDEYILVFDDALSLKTGKAEVHSKESLKRTWGIEITI